MDARHVAFGVTFTLAWACSGEVGEAGRRHGGNAATGAGGGVATGSAATGGGVAGSATMGASGTGGNVTTGPVTMGSTVATGGAGGGGGGPGTGGSSSGSTGSATGGSGSTVGAGGNGSGGAPPAGDCGKWSGGVGAKSEWVSVGADGKLVYKSMARGDHILDFSHAGYMGGGVAIPKMPVAATVTPGDGDDTQRIQSAIDTVSRLAMSQGVRGAVVVEAGTYELQGTLNIRASGVELRGSGSASTIIQLTGGPHLFVNMTGSGALQTTGTAANITDTYVPSGATSVTVDNPALFKMGDTVLVRREITQKWIDFMQPVPLVRDGAEQTWMTPGQLVETERSIVAITGNTLRFDVPLTDAIDKDYVTPTGATVIKYTFGGRIANLGVSGFRVNGVASTADIGAEKYRLVDFGSVVDAWARDLRGEEAVDAFIIRKQAKRITIEDVVLNRSVTTSGSAGPADFGITGSQVLIQRTQSNGNGQFSIVTHERVPGPNVLLEFSGSGTGRAQPHRRWATGLLYDRANFPQGSLELMHRGSTGDGYGWAIGWGVIWNGVAKQFLVQQPPGSANFCIGCVGQQLQNRYPGAPQSVPVVPMGIIDSKDTPVAPASLYLAQLCERLGPQAVANVGY